MFLLYINDISNNLTSHIRLFADGTVPLTLPSYFIPTQYPTRRHHGKHFIIPSNSTAAYQQSFYPRTIREWNNLPIAIIETIDIEGFTNKLSDLNLI